MNIRTGLVIALAVGGAVGCKKKPEEAPPTAGSAEKPTEGSAGSGSAEAPKAPLAGKELAAKYVECTNHLNAGKADDFKANCITADFLAHPVDAVEVKGADAVLAQFKEERAAFPDLKIAPQVIFVNGRTLLAVGLMTGTP